MRFQSLVLSGWRQFRQVQFSFHPRLTVLTGANGAGKTTILNLLSRHFGWEGALVSTPHLRKGLQSYSPDSWASSSERHLERLKSLLDATENELDLEMERDSVEDPIPPGQTRAIGTISYQDGASSTLRAPSGVGPTFQLTIENQQLVRGLHIPSHRPIYSYQQVDSIPTRPRQREQMFNEYMNIVRTRYLGQHHARTPNYFLKETLLSLALFGYGNRYVVPNIEAQQTFQDFQAMLRKILPPSLGFRRLSIRVPEIVLLTRSGEVSLDAVSGGIASLIDMCWQIFVYADPTTEFVVTIDEPENHLHPEMQKVVLATLLDAFPNVQFIVATHNPFIVTSVPESSIYVMTYDESRRVISEPLASGSRAGSASDTLRDVLGLDDTLPNWVSRRLRETLERYSNLELNEATAARLREELVALGLGDALPTTLARLIHRQRI